MKTLDISGFGGSYEEGCQRILWFGLEWIKDKPLDVWEDTYSYRNVTGLLITGTKLDGLEKILSEDKFLNEGGMTGAMHHASFSHLYYIHKNGYKAWLKRGGEDRIIETTQNYSPELLEWLENHPYKETVTKNE